MFVLKFKSLTQYFLDLEIPCLLSMFLQELMDYWNSIQNQCKRLYEVNEERKWANIPSKNRLLDGSWRNFLSLMNGPI